MDTAEWFHFECQCIGAPVASIGGLFSVEVSECSEGFDINTLLVSMNRTMSRSAHLMMMSECSDAFSLVCQNDEWIDNVVRLWCRVADWILMMRLKTCTIGRLRENDGTEHGAVLALTAKVGCCAVSGESALKRK